MVYVKTGFAKQTFIPYKSTFGLNFLQGRVIQIDTTEKFVVLDNGKVFIYFFFFSFFKKRCYLAMMVLETKQCLTFYRK